MGEPPFIIILEYLRAQALRDTARIPPPPCALPTAAAPGSGRHEPDHCAPSPHAHSSFSNCSKKRNSVSPLIASARTHTPCTARSAHIIPSP